MKRVFTIILCALMVCAIAFPIYASETDTVQSEGISDEGEVTTEVIENHTFLGRIWEWVSSHKGEVVTAAGNGLLFVFMWIFKRKTGTGNAQLAATLGTVASQTASNPQVVSAVNSLIDGYNVMSEKYERYGIAEGDRDKFIAAVMAQSTAILEILNTVYSNSNNLPQGVKDLIRVKYAHCLKTIDSDEALKQIVGVVRNEIGGAISDSSKGAEDDKQD